MTFSRRPFAARVLGPTIVAYALIGVAIGVANLTSTGVYGNLGLRLDMFVAFSGGAVWSGVHLLLAVGGVGLIGGRAWAIRLLAVLLTGLALYNGSLFLVTVVMSILLSGEGHLSAGSAVEDRTIALWGILESIPTVCLVLFNGRRREEVERYDTARILKTDADS